MDKFKNFRHFVTLVLEKFILRYFVEIFRHVWRAYISTKRAGCSTKPIRLSLEIEMPQPHKHNQKDADDENSDKKRQKWSLPWYWLNLTRTCLRCAAKLGHEIHLDVQ